MRRALAMAAMVAAFPMFVHGAEEFAFHAPVTPDGAPPFQRLYLPFEVYREARPDLGDVRVLNGAGAPVPIAFAGEPEQVRETPPSRELPMFPVAATHTPDGLPSNIMIRTSDGTLIQLRQGAAETKGAEEAAPAAYLLDASLLKEPVRAMDFDWDAVPGTEVVRVQIESSDDLKNWAPVASSALVSLAHEGRALRQPRVEFAPRTAKYYRITWAGRGVRMKSAKSLAAERVTPAPRELRTVEGAAGKKEGDIEFDLGARLPVESLRIVPQEKNSVLAGTFHVRDEPRGDWRALSPGTFYRITREGGELESGALEIGRRPARYVMFRPEAGSFASATALPKLEARWRSGQLVFVRRGEGPFELAFGNRAVKAALLPVSTLMPDYEPLAEMKLPQAKVGPVQGEHKEAGAWESWMGEVTAKKVILWAVLVVGVAVLGFMAWRLSGQMQRGDSRRRRRK